jgi:hypothetical protein
VTPNCVALSSSLSWKPNGLPVMFPPFIYFEDGVVRRCMVGGF